MTTVSAAPLKNRQPRILQIGLVFLAALVFSAAFLWINYQTVNWLSPRFESTGHTTWGIIQRLYLILPLAAISVWRPRQVGFQIGTIARHWKLLLVMLLANVGVVAGYRLLAGSTPYSGLSLLFNEIVTVPLVEEVMWRGVVFAAILAALRKFQPEGSAALLAAWLSGICFGLLHANNILFGYPAGFVALQTVNALVWGILYGIARAKTGSIYPSLVMHAAMNLVAVLV